MIRDPFLTECGECGAPLALVDNPGYDVICEPCEPTLAGELR